MAKQDLLSGLNPAIHAFNQSFLTMLNFLLISKVKTSNANPLQLQALTLLLKTKQSFVLAKKRSYVFAQRLLLQP